MCIYIYIYIYINSQTSPILLKSVNISEVENASGTLKPIVNVDKTELNTHKITMKVERFTNDG